jgi:hypothetical protein
LDCWSLVDMREECIFLVSYGSESTINHKVAKLKSLTVNENWKDL